MKALIDGDILRYEVGFGAETGWKEFTEGRETIPPFDYVERLLIDKINNIVAVAGADEYTIYLTTAPSFRHEIATTRPYKGNRKHVKPFHFDNLTAYISNSHLPVYLCDDGFEADDEIAIRHSTRFREQELGDVEYSESTRRYNGRDTIVCSRDKDLRQVAGPHYTWELGRQPSFGPVDIDELGFLEYDHEKKKITKGTGFLFFTSQLITGDTADNIPGIEGAGDVRAIDELSRYCTGTSSDDGRTTYTFDASSGSFTTACSTLVELAHDLYRDRYGHDGTDRLNEQGKLLYLIRNKADPLWSVDMYL